jgi:hypothetical protein
LTNPEKVYQFLKAHRREGFCDDCIEKEIGVDRHGVNTIASTLALFPLEFGRTKEVCPHGCASHEKWVNSAT